MRVIGNLLFVLTLLLCSCQKPAKQQKPEKIIPAFKVEKITKSTVIYEGGYSKDASAAYYLVTGEIINLSSFTLDSYDIEFSLVFTDERGESFIKDYQNYLFSGDNGFGGISVQKLPWKKGENKKFKLNRWLSNRDLVYPISKVQAVLKITASDPHGNEINELLGEFDITEKWLISQKKYLKTLN